MTDLVARLRSAARTADDIEGTIPRGTGADFFARSGLLREAADALEAAEAELKRAEERRGAAYLSAIERRDAAEARAEKAERELKQWHDSFDASLAPIPPNPAGPDNAKCLNCAHADHQPGPLGRQCAFCPECYPHPDSAQHKSDPVGGWNDSCPECLTDFVATPDKPNHCEPNDGQEEQD
jgi:hypothetical protein